MRRISNEDGEPAGFRNIGRFFLFSIPASLGGAAILWLMAWAGWIDLSRERRIERRSMNSVGLASLPTTPIVVSHHDATCLKIDSSFMDGQALIFYAKNTCKGQLNLPNYSYRVLARDGTTIKSARWAFSGDMVIKPGERREQRTGLGEDDRIERVELYAID